jgi:hypothetical protein
MKLLLLFVGFSLFDPGRIYAQSYGTSILVGSHNVMIFPTDFTMHQNGSLFVSDKYNQAILAVSQTGALSV